MVRTLCLISCTFISAMTTLRTADAQTVSPTDDQPTIEAARTENVPPGNATITIDIDANTQVMHWATPGAIVVVRASTTDPTSQNTRIREAVHGAKIVSLDERAGANLVEVRLLVTAKDRESLQSTKDTIGFAGFTLGLVTHPHQQRLCLRDPPLHLEKLKLETDNATKLTVILPPAGRSERVVFWDGLWFPYQKWMRYRIEQAERDGEPNAQVELIECPS